MKIFPESSCTLIGKQLCKVSAPSNQGNCDNMLGHWLKICPPKLSAARKAWARKFFSRPFNSERLMKTYFPPGLRAGSKFYIALTFSPFWPNARTNSSPSTICPLLRLVQILGLTTLHDRYSVSVDRRGVVLKIESRARLVDALRAELHEPIFRDRRRPRKPPLRGQK